MTLLKEFCDRMRPLLGNQWSAFIFAYDAPLRRGLRVNTAKIETEPFRRLFSHPLEPSPFASNSFYLDAEFKAGGDPLHHAGAYYMQEPSAASAVTVLAPRPGERILDLCAAPGGKSTQIATALGDSGLLWSNEYVASRARILAQNLERMGVRRAVVSNKDSGTLCENLAGFFDGVLVDAPCSGEGMFRKEPQALAEWSLDNIRLCAARQQEIIQNAAMAVRPGGRLVYSTCTFAPEENECVVATFLANNPDFTLEVIDVPWGSPGFPFDAVKEYTSTPGCEADLTGCRRIFPHQGGEGHFIALLRRRGAASATSAVPYPLPKSDPYAKEAAILYADCFTDAPQGDLVTLGDQVRLLPPGLPDCAGLGVLTAGIAVAQLCKNRLEPCHSAFIAAHGNNCRRLADFSPDDPRLLAFLHGQEIPFAGENGWTAVAVAGIPVSFGKVSGGKLKNRYPKGLRLL